MVLLGVRRPSITGTPQVVHVLEAHAIRLDNQGAPMPGEHVGTDPDYLRRYDSLSLMWWDEAAKRGYVKGAPVARIEGPGKK